MGVGTAVEEGVVSFVGRGERVGAAVATSVTVGVALVEPGGGETVGATVGVEPTAHEYSSPAAAMAKPGRRMTKSFVTTTDARKCRRSP
jgi:hypothetical protein